jgi:hypothetical protein
MWLMAADQRQGQGHVGDRKNGPAPERQELVVTNIAGQEAKGSVGAAAVFFLFSV